MMSVSPKVAAARRSLPAGCLRFARIARTTLGVASLVAALPLSARAQSSATEASPWELRFTSGALVATGDLRNELKDASMTGLQVSWLLRPSLAITGSFAWASSHDLSAAANPMLDIFTSDLGLEARPATWFASHAITFSPFVGLGGGVQSFNYRHLAVTPSNNLAGYASVGGEVGVGRVGLRIEVRDYAGSFTALQGASASSVKNNVMILAALRFSHHGARQD